jgi:hypothetical protein
LRNRCRIVARQSGKLLAQISRSEALRRLPEQYERMQERVCLLIGKAQPQASLAADGYRAINCLEGIFAEDAVVAHAFDLDEPALGCKADVA